MARTAPAIVGAPTYFQSGSSTASFTIATPTDLQAGDLLVVVYRTSGSTSTVDFSNPAFTRRGREFAASDATRRVSGIQSHTVTDPASEPASYTFTKATADSRTVAAMFVLRGVDLADPVAGFSNGTTSSGATSSADAFPTSSDPTLLVGLWVAEITSPNSNVPVATPAGLTQVAHKGSTEGTASTRSTLWAGAGAASGATTQPALSLTWGAGYTAMTAYVVAFRGADVADPDPDPDPPVTYDPGFPNVAALLAMPGATIAHRGGSDNYPEFSQYAYDHAAALGYGALEFSCGWTSDNVPFGLGDQYLDRAAGVTGSVDPKSMTWAALQANYANVLNPVAGQPSQPFLRLVDFLDRYTPTHVVAVDPKFGVLNTALIDVMLDICDAHGGPSKIIVKFDSPGAGATSVATRARARGYTTMNYYGSNLTALASEQQNWDLLGILYSASQATFDAALAYGKPLWAAVIPDQAGYDAAIMKGARLAMIRNVVAVEPVSAGAYVPLFDGYDTYLLGAGSAMTLLEMGES